MSLGLIGRKIGMTRIFTENGESLPVTVIEVSNNRVTQIKNTEIDGYTAVQLAFGKKKATRVHKSLVGHFSKASVEAGCVLREFRVDKDDHLESLRTGAVIEINIFKF